MPRSCDTEDKLGDSYPLTPLQQGMVYHSLMFPRSGAYVQQLVGDLYGHLDMPRFKEAWQRTAALHPVLRTRFHQDAGGDFSQYVANDAAFEWAEEDWSHLGCYDCDATWLRYLAEDRSRGFELSDTPLMRLALVLAPHNSHRFLWTYHHALLDGRSQFRVLKDLFGFYDALIEGGEYQAGESPAFREHVLWLGRQDKEPAKHFWRESLKGFEAATQVAVALSSDDVESYGEERGVRQALLTEEATRTLESFAAENSVTVGTLLQASWAALLARYSGEEDVVFGATRACRHLPVEGAESMVGFLINTVPMRVKVPPDMPVRAWVKDVRAKWVAMRPYEHTSLADIQAWSGFGPKRPLFENILVFENYSFNKVLHAQGGVWLHRAFELLEKGTHPLVALAYGGARLRLKLAYDRSRYDDESAVRMLGHWRTLLEGIAEDPDGRVEYLPLLTDAEQDTILIDWNNTDKKYPKHLCLHQLFEAQAAKTPDKAAVFFEKETLTYKDLNARANRLAHHLQRMGVVPDSRVAVCLARTPALIVSVLAVLKAGGAYVPLDSAYPKEQLSYMLEESGAAVLLTQDDFRDRLPEHGLRTVLVDAGNKAMKQESDSNPESAVSPDNLAYAIYTSGSTGQPKLIGVEHKSAVNVIFYTTHAVFTTAELAVVPFADSISFDASVYRIFSPLSVGGGIVLLNSLFDLPRCRWADSITAIGGAPSVMKALVDDFPLPESVRVVSVGAEVAGKELLQRLAAHPHIKRIINFYGPTETTIYCTHSLLFKRGETPAEPSRTFETNIIGKPIWNVRIYILDAHLDLVPVGVAGEICVGGDCLARGYLNQPELTAEKFITDPFSSDARARLYKTGDLGLNLPDGSIEFVGRIDNQVKIRGLRVEPEGVAAVLNHFAAVRESIVHVTEDAAGEKQLVAYVVLAAAAGDAAGSVPMSADGLRDYLEEKLPRHMVPSAFVILDELPRNSTGKSDFNRLPKAALESQRPRRIFEPPHTDLERTLAQIWKEVLSVARIGLHDDLFELGGDSLSATRIVARVNHALVIDLSVRAVFDAPTVAKCAIAVDEWLLAQAEIEDIETRLSELERKPQAPPGDTPPGDDGR